LVLCISVRFWFILICGAALTLVGGCSALTTFNTLTPKDSGGSLVGDDIAYGPDPRQKLDVYAPDDAKPKTPVIVFIYGGGWNTGDRSDYSFVAKALTAQGYVTAVVDYRLVPQVRFPTFLEDCALGVRWVHEHIAQFNGDPDRIYLMGHSAGAYNVMMLALDHHYLAQAGVPLSVIKGAGPYDFLPLDVDETIAAFSKTPDLATTQPINFVRPGEPPIFLGQGAADTLVYPRNTKALAAKLRAAGDVVDEKYYPGVTHPGILLALSRPFRDNGPVLADVMAFFRAH
jgi:acetyl esterase/lipase